MLIVKGVNVYPTAIKNLISTFIPDVTGDMRAVLESAPPRVVSPLKLKVEHGSHVGKEELPGLALRIAQALHDAIKIRPDIKLVPPGTLPKETRKTPFFEKVYES